MPSLALYLLVAVSCLHGVLSDRFDQCKIRFERILNGTEIYGQYNNVTIQSCIHHGPIKGMNPKYAETSRDEFLAVTTDGCQAICGKQIDWYWSSDVGLTLGIISNWILPILALLAAFPFDSIHKSRGRVWGTMSALFNWLGSPQLALTTIMFSIYQNVLCARVATRGASNSNITVEDQDGRAQARKDSLYVLCCMSQYKLEREMDRDFLNVLIYGLITPFSDTFAGIGNEEMHPSDEKRENARKWTTELLDGMASQLRVLRRRGVYPAFISIFLFCVAYAISLVMAFANIGDRTTTHSLAVGILISWLPNLLLFAIIDRNPISAERSRTLFIRWMCNVKAVKAWENTDSAQTSQGLNYQLPPLDFENQEPSSTQTQWWPNTNEQSLVGDAQFPLGEFVGQGREIGFNGLAEAVAQGILDRLDREASETLLQADIVTDITDSTENRLKSRPLSWWTLSLFSLLLVWVEISMAFMISYNIPTVGIGCRSGSYLIYGALSTIPWVINAFPASGVPGNPGKARKGTIIFFCMLSTVCLLFILFAAFSGVLKNCWCRGGHRRYLDFENAQFYRDKDHFDVVTYWRASAIVGALPMMFTFSVSWFLLHAMKPLWQAPGGTESQESQGVELLEPEANGFPNGHQRADTAWLS